MKHTGTKYLETERLKLRRFVIEDAEAMFKNWASDIEVTKYLTWPAHGSAEVIVVIWEDVLVWSVTCIRGTDMESAVLFIKQNLVQYVQKLSFGQVSIMYI